jgi:photosystem II stability/assembly factor-like uncharacterized protein
MIWDFEFDFSCCVSFLKKMYSQPMLNRFSLTFKKVYMKKTIFTLFFMIFLQLAWAQVSFVGNPEYGRLKNVVYDKNVQNRVYATTYVDHHILISNDNGASWDVLFSLPNPEYAPDITEMRLTNNGSALSFIEFFGLSNPLNRISVLDLQSLSIIKVYNIPGGASIKGIEDYCIYDNGVMNIAAVLANTEGGVFGEDRVYYTTNGGNNWSIIYDTATSESGVRLRDIEMDPGNPDILYIARGVGRGAGNPNYGGLLKSTDAGVTWTKSLDDLVLGSIAIDPQNPEVLYAGSGNLFSYPTQHRALYKSLDGGQNWVEQTGITWSSSSGGLRIVNRIGINPNDPNHIVVLGDENVAVTKDSGNTWTTTFYDGLFDDKQYLLGDAVGFNPYNLNQVIISNQHHPKLSSDGGITLTTLENSFFIGMGRTSIVKGNASDHLIYGVQHGYVVRNLSTNQETTIHTLPLNENPLPGADVVKQTRVDKKNAGRVYTLSAFSSMGRTLNLSNDYGLTESHLYTTFDNFLSAAETDPTNPNIAWLALFDGISSTLIKSDFTDINNPQNTFITIPYASDYLYGIKINPSNSDEVMITVGNQLLKTSDGGSTWIQITAGLQELTVPNIALGLVQNPLNPNQYTIPASNGIYTSIDGGNTWSRIYNQIIHRVEHSTEQDGQIVGIGNSSGAILPKVIYSHNGGMSWQERISSRYFDTTVLDGTVRFISPSTAEVYLTSNALGILKDIIDFSTLGTVNPDIIKDEIIIYPNPVSDVINIKLDNKISKFKVSIYNTAGQLVSVHDDKKSIDVSQLRSGVYLLKIEAANLSTLVKKIIKK